MNPYFKFLFMTFIGLYFLSCASEHPPNISIEMAESIKVMNALHDGEICCQEYGPIFFNKTTIYDYYFSAPHYSRSYLHFEVTVPDSDSYARSLDDSHIMLIVYDGDLPIFYRNQLLSYWPRDGGSFSLMQPSCLDGNPRSLTAKDGWVRSCDDFITEAHHNYRVILNVLNDNNAVASYHSKLIICSFWPKDTSNAP